MNEDLVSVVIPSYNRKKLITRAIDSVLAQTYFNLEILICDDGSTDGTKESIQEIYSTLIQNQKIRWLDCGKNGGPAIPRNQGTLAARGRWVAYLDSDDFWFPKKLENQLELLRSKNQFAACSNAKCITESGEEKSLFFSDSETKTLTWSQFWFENHVICSSLIAEKDKLIEAGLFPTDRALQAIEDYALWIQFSYFYPIFYLGEPLVGYQMASTDSISKREETTVSQARSTVRARFELWVQNQNPNIQFLIERLKLKAIEKIRTIIHHLRSE